MKLMFETGSQGGLKARCSESHHEMNGVGCSLIVQCADSYHETNVFVCPGTPLRLGLKAVSRLDVQNHTMKCMVSEDLETDSTAPSLRLKVINRRKP